MYSCYPTDLHIFCLVLIDQTSNVFLDLECIFLLFQPCHLPPYQSSAHANYFGALYCKYFYTNIRSLIAMSQNMFESNCDWPSPCFNQLLVRNILVTFFPILTLAAECSTHILVIFMIFLETLYFPTLAWQKQVVDIPVKYQRFFQQLPYGEYLVRSDRKPYW